MGLQLAGCMLMQADAVWRSSRSRRARHAVLPDACLPGPPLSRRQDREDGTAGAERWYCFDDTSVEPWDPASLDKDCFGGRFVPEGLTQVAQGGGGGVCGVCVEGLVVVVWKWGASSMGSSRFQRHLSAT